MAATGHVVFSHGSDGTPFGTKIRALYEIAEAVGYEVAAVDYRGVDDPDERVQMLQEFCRGFAGHLVLVGSSLGGYVSLAAAPTLHAGGVFLMAPAIYQPGVPALKRGVPDCPIALVHGWRGLLSAFAGHFWQTQDLGTQGIGLTYYRPLVTVSFVLNWLLFGGAAWGFHLVNLLLHASAALLATRVALRWLGRPWLAVLVGVLFAVHPTRSESVTWIAGRTDLLGAREAAVVDRHA